MAFEKKDFSEVFYKSLGKALEDKDYIGAFFKEMKAVGQLERINNLYRCEDKATKKKVWFRLNQEQLKYYKEQTKRDLILKPRQVGFTTLAIVISLDNCLFEDGSNEGLMAHKQVKAGELFQRVRDMLKWFTQDWGKLAPISTNRDSAKKIVFEKVCNQDVNSFYEVALDFRSGALTRLHISEASRCKLEWVTGSIDSIPMNGSAVMETTANGRDMVFFGNWKETKESKRKNDIFVWEHHFFPWYEHYPEPGHGLVTPKGIRWDEKEKELLSLGVKEISLVWRRWKIKENFKTEPEKFEEEYPSDDDSCFLGGRSVIPRKYLLLMDKWAIEPIKIGNINPKDGWFQVIDNPDGDIRIWENPRAEEEYVIGADPAEGVGKDYAAAWVKRRSNGKYVCRVHNKNLPPEQFALTLYLLARFYNQAYICFELNNHGHVVKDRLYNIYHYSNLYHRRETDTLTGKIKEEVGFVTSYNSKEKIVMNWAARLREGKIKTFDEELITECTNFQRNESGKLEAVSGSHDDLFMAACLTEEMDDSLGPYNESLNSDDGDVKLNPMTGFPE